MLHDIYQNLIYKTNFFCQIEKWYRDAPRLKLSQKKDEVCDSGFFCALRVVCPWIVNVLYNTE